MLTCFILQQAWWSFSLPCLCVVCLFEYPTRFGLWHYNWVSFCDMLAWDENTNGVHTLGSSLLRVNYIHFLYWQRKFVHSIGLQFRHFGMWRMIFSFFDMLIFEVRRLLNIIFDVARPTLRLCIAINVVKSLLKFSSILAANFSNVVWTSFKLTCVSNLLIQHADSSLHGICVLFIFIFIFYGRSLGSMGCFCFVQFLKVLLILVWLWISFGWLRILSPYLLLFGEIFWRQKIRNSVMFRKIWMHL